MSDEWGTPPRLFEILNKEFLFTVDVASTDKNKKLPKNFTKKDNGLKRSWAGERVFCNPPFSDIGTWVAKAFSERNKADIIVMVLPVRTDRKYFHEMILGHAEIRFIKGRPNYIPIEGQKITNCPFNTMAVVFRKDRVYQDKTQSSLKDFSFTEDPEPMDVYLKLGSIHGQEINDDDEVTIMFNGDISIDGNCWRQAVILTDGHTGSMFGENIEESNQNEAI